MSKKPNPSIISSENAIKQVDAYTELYTWRSKPVSLTFLERLATDLLDWATNDKKAYKLSTFLRDKKIDSTDFSRWMTRCPQLAAAHKNALMAIGDRREIGALERKLDANIVLRTMARYDPGYKELEEWRAKLAKDNESSGNITVEIKQFPETEVVTQRKIINEQRKKDKNALALGE